MQFCCTVLALPLAPWMCASLAEGYAPACVTRVLLGWNVTVVLAVSLPLAWLIQHGYSMHFSAVDAVGQTMARRAARQALLSNWAEQFSAMTSLTGGSGH